MEPLEHLFDCVINWFNFIKNPIIKAIVQIITMAIFTALLVFIMIAITKLIFLFIGSWDAKLLISINLLKICLKYGLNSFHTTFHCSYLHLHTFLLLFRKKSTHLSTGTCVFFSTKEKSVHSAKTHPHFFIYLTKAHVSVIIFTDSYMGPAY